MVDPQTPSIRAERAISRVTFVVGIAALFALSACRSRRMEAVGTRLDAGQIIEGRLPEGRTAQSFTIEGVESSLLDFRVVSDRGDLAAPAVSLLDPSGKPVDVAPHMVTPDGAATVRVSGVVLLQTGTYQVTVTPKIPNEPVYYKFHYALGFPPIEGMRATLSATEPRPIYVSAPQGGLVNIRIAPVPGSGLVPDIRGVRDPWGGRALDPARRPPGSPPAQVSHGQDGSLYLTFAAPISGRYVILAAAEPGRGGPGQIDASVVPRGPPGAIIRHPNRAPLDYGVPSATSGSASDAGVGAPR
jgi:hypothetical protein